MEQEDMEFNLELRFEDEHTIKLENVKIGDIYQQVEALSPNYPHHPCDFMSLHLEKIKQQKLNELRKFLVTDGTRKIKNWFILSCSRTK
jgi:hypothetical protein